MQDKITIGAFILSIVVHTGLLSSFSLSPPEPEQEMVIEMASIEIELPPPVEEVVIEEEEPPPIEPAPEPEPEPPPPEPMPEPVSEPEPEPVSKATTPLPEVKDVFPQVKEVRENVTLKQDVAGSPPVKVALRPHQFTETEEALNRKKAKARENFLILVRREIERAKYYPRWARQRGFEGIVTVEFVISQEGKGGDMNIVESSGYKLLDEAALTTLERASPFPKLPEGLGERLKITIPISYRLIEE